MTGNQTLSKILWKDIEIGGDSLETSPAGGKNGYVGEHIFEEQQDQIVATTDRLFLLPCRNAFFNVSSLPFFSKKGLRTNLKQLKCKL